MEKYLNVDRAVAVNPVTYMGAEPVFMDCGDDINIDPDKLDNECKMVDAKVINKKTDKEIEENRDILAQVLEKIALLVGNTTLQFSVILLYNK
jgi:carbamoylphosphate synthase large subunit